MVDLVLILDGSAASNPINVNQGSFLDPTSTTHSSGPNLDSSSVDLAVPANTSIYSPISGRVVGAYAGYTDTNFPIAPTTGPAVWGNYVTIEYNVGLAKPLYITLAHLTQASAAVWVNALTSANGPVEISSLDKIGTVATASETPYGVHLHINFAHDAGNYPFPNSIALGTNSAENATLLSQLYFNGTAISEIVTGDDIVATPFTTVNGNSLNNTLQDSGGYISSIYNGNGGDDVIFDGAGNDVVNGGAGRDYLSSTGNFDNDVFNGGGGVDMVSYANHTIIGLTINLSSGRAFGTRAGDDRLINIEDAQGSQKADTIVGNNIGNFLDGRLGNDVLTGLSGDDFLLGQGGIDTLDGGEGFDTAGYWFDHDGNGGFTGIRADLAAGTCRDTSNGLDTLVSIEHVIGSVFSDVISGSALRDVLEGVDGNDTLNGRYGNDFLSGGAGLDSFVFNSTLNASANVDVVADFDVASDTVVLDDDVFTAFAALTTGNTIAPAAFWIGSVAHDASDRIIYNPANGNLYYDRDGNGTAFAQVLFADLASNLAMTAADFKILE